MADRSELKPCPFCGRTDLLGFGPRLDSHFVGVRCRACGYIGPSKLSLDEFESAAHWNNRRSTSEPRADQSKPDTINVPLSAVDLDLIAWALAVAEQMSSHASGAAAIAELRDRLKRSRLLP